MLRLLFCGLWFADYSLNCVLQDAVRWYYNQAAGVERKNKMTQKSLGQWPLGQIIVLVLIAAFAGLVFDLRFEHNHILAKHEIGWTPIVYSGVAVVVGSIGLAFWDRGGRMLLRAIFAAGFVVGALGFWYHGQGHILADIGQMLSVWTGSHPNPVHEPPLLAPLAFAGIGLLGLLACSKHFTPQTAPLENSRELQASHS